MDDNFQKFIDETGQLDEGQMGLVASIVAALLAVQNYVTAQDIQQRLPKNATAAQVQAAVVAAAAERDKVETRDDRGYTTIQAINIVARTLFWEARGETNRGRKLVATVIWNRAGQDRKQLTSVCLKKKQFSCWNKAHDDASYLDPKTFQIKVPKAATKDANSAKVWDDCKSLAQQLVCGGFESEGNYNSYYNPNLASSASQAWTSRLTGTTEEGDHIFGYLADQDPKAKAQGKTQATTAQGTRTYRVKKGDTITAIAKRLMDDGSCPSFKDTKALVAAIVSTNKLRNNGNSIKVGQVLNIPTRG